MPLEEVHHLLRHPSGRASGLCHRRPAAPASPGACPAAAARARAPTRTHIPSLKQEQPGAHTLHAWETDVIGRAKTRTPAPHPAPGVHHTMSYCKAYLVLLKKTFPMSFKTCWIFGGPQCTACRILAPRPGIEPAPPTAIVWSLNCYTTREVPPSGFLRKGKALSSCNPH